MANMYDDDFTGKPYVAAPEQRAPVAAPTPTAPANLYDADFGGATVPGRPQPAPPSVNKPFGELRPASTVRRNGSATKRKMR